MANPGQFAKKMRQRAGGIERNVSNLVKKTALTIDRELVLSTPVDTGRARSNWQVSVGSANTDRIEAYVKGDGGSSAGANAQAAIDQAAAEVRGHKPGRDIYISNNLPYIGRLNEGSSAQAPEQFIEIAVQLGVSAVRGAKVVE
jgi:hypothetical protein